MSKRRILFNNGKILKRKYETATAKDNGEQLRSVTNLVKTEA